MAFSRIPCLWVSHKGRVVLLWSRWGMARRRGCCPCVPQESVLSVPDVSKEVIEQVS